MGGWPRRRAAGARRPTVRSMSAKASSAEAQKHPPGLAVLYLTEVWERFSFYGMKALLVLYLNDGVLSEARFRDVIGSPLVVACFGQPTTVSKLCT